MLLCLLVAALPVVEFESTVALPEDRATYERMLGEIVEQASTASSRSSPCNDR